MQIDFRDVYASILKDWFQVPEADIQPLFEHTVTYYQVLGACNVGLEEEKLAKDALLLFPNPAVSHTTVRFTAQNEWVKISVYDMNGRMLKVVFDGNLSQGLHTIPFEIQELQAGQYIVRLDKESGVQTAHLQKVH